MDLRQIRYFRTVAEEGQVTRAAKKLHMAQPPLSQQIKLMEEELGLQLFDRQGRRLDLTDAGHVFYEKTGRLLDELEETIMEVKEVQDGIFGTLRLGATKSCFSYVSDPLRKMREDHPTLTYQLREGDTFFLSECIRNREIDMAVVRLPVDSSDFGLLPLISEPYVLVAPESWEMVNGQSDTLQVESLKGVPLMLLHRISGSGQFELIVNECMEHGFEPDIICECPDPTMLLSLTSSGIGATIVPESTLSAFSFPNVKSYKFANLSTEAQAAIIWPKDRYLNKATKTLISYYEREWSLEKPGSLPNP